MDDGRREQEMDGFDQWALDNGLPTTVEVEGEQVLALAAIVAETNLDDPCCFRRDLVALYPSEAEARADAGRFLGLGELRIVRADEVVQVLANGHVRLAAEGRVR